MGNQMHHHMPDHRLLPAERISGSRLLLFALQPGPAAATGDQSPSECGTAPRDNETTVPAPELAIIIIAIIT